MPTRLLRRARLTIDQICGPRAIAPVAAVGAPAAAQLTNILSIIGLQQDAIGARILINTIAGVINVALLLTVSWYLRRVYPVRAPAVLVFGTFILAGIIRSISAALAASLGVSFLDANSAATILQSIFITVLWLSLIAYLLNGLDRQQVSIGLLREEARRLAELRTGARSELRTTQREVDSLVGDTVAPPLESLLDRINETASRQATAGELHELAAAIREQSRDAVQSLGRGLVVNDAVPIVTPVQDRSDTKTRLDLPAFFATAAAIRPFRPWICALLVSLSLVGHFIDHLGLRRGVSAALLSIVVNTLLLALAGRLHSRLISRRSAAVHIGSWLGLIVMCGILNALVVAIPFHAGTDDRVVRLAVIGMIVAEVFYGVSLGLATAASVRLKRTTRSLQATVVSIDLETRGLHEAQLAIRRRVGIVLHGRVQGRLLADSLRIDHAAEAAEKSPEDPIAGENLQQVLLAVSADFTQLIGELSSLGAAPNDFSGLPDIMSAITAEWNGVVDVSFDLEPPDLGRRFSDLAPIIAEIFREAIVNAAKHANASSVAAHVSLRDGAIHIVVDDNGTGTHRGGGGTTQASKALPGVGLDALLDARYSVTLESRPSSGARLMVLIPTGQQ